MLGKFKNFKKRSFFAKISQGCRETPYNAILTQCVYLGDHHPQHLEFDSLHESGRPCKPPQGIQSGHSRIPDMCRWLPCLDLSDVHQFHLLFEI